MDYFWLSILAVIIVISIIIAYYASAHEQTSSQPVSSKHCADIDVTFADLCSSLENTSECYLCGNDEESLMSYYRNFDTIGLISLNDWYVIDFPLKNYDENEMESAASTSFLSGNTGEISYSSDGTPSRGMTSIDVTLPENYEVDTNVLEKHLCQNCLNKVAASLEYRKTDGENKEAIFRGGRRIPFSCDGLTAVPDRAYALFTEKELKKIYNDRNEFYKKLMQMIDSY